MFRFALGGAASRVLKTEFNPAHVNSIMGYIFASLRSLDWIEVSLRSIEKFEWILLFLQDVAATETRKLEWVDEEEIGAASNEIDDAPDNDDEDADSDDEGPEDER